MKARLVVFPVKGRNWCFSRSIESNQATGSQSASSTRTIKDLWKQIYANDKAVTQNVESVIDFVADKMNHAWSGLEKAPDGSFKNKLHNLGLLLLSRVKPSEIFLKSITKEISKVEVTYPASLNPRLVRRRLRHIAISHSMMKRYIKITYTKKDYLIGHSTTKDISVSHTMSFLSCQDFYETGRNFVNRGDIIHRRYFYGSVTLLPLTSAFSVLPLPNVPFFWILFRTYSHWRALQVIVTLGHFRVVVRAIGATYTCTSFAETSHILFYLFFGLLQLQGSERLLLLVTDSSERLNTQDGKGTSHEDEKLESRDSPGWPLVLKPSKELEKLLSDRDDEKSLSKSTRSDICKAYHLDTNAVIKYQNSV